MSPSTSRSSSPRGSWSVDDPPDAVWLVPLCACFAALEMLVKLNSGALCLVLFLLVVWRLASAGRSRRGPVRRVVRDGAAASLARVRAGALGTAEVAARVEQHVVLGYTGATARGGSGQGSSRVLAVLLLAGLAALLVALAEAASQPLDTAAADRGCVRLRLSEGRLCSRGRARPVLLRCVRGGRPCVCVERRCAHRRGDAPCRCSGRSIATPDATFRSLLQADRASPHCSARSARGRRSGGAQARGSRRACGRALEACRAGE